MRADPRRRTGALLFEVIVGITILAIATVGWIGLLAQTRISIAQNRRAELQSDRADDLLRRMRALSVGALSARVGTTNYGSLDVVVSRSRTTLFRVVVADTTSHAVVLETEVYRRAPGDSL